MEMADLDTTQAARGLWLVKAPPAVAHQWSKACQLSMNSTNAVADPNVGRELARIHIRKNSEAVEELTIEVAGTSDKPQPQVFKLQGGKVDPMHILSYQMDNGKLSRPCVEGVVDKKYDLVPSITSMDQHGAMVVDPAYAQMNKLRTIKAMEKGRSVLGVENTREHLMKLGNALKAGDPSLKRLAQRVEVKKETVKRMKLSNDELEKLLFRLFEQQTHWEFKQLQKETEQPASFLKSVLADVAILNKRGPNAGTYEIKKEFRADK